MTQKNKPGSCPICGAPPWDKFKPFCSARCADIDLGRWLKESYRIETLETPSHPDKDPSDSE